MNPDTAAAVNEHLGEAFDHLREAIMLAIAGEPNEGAMGRLERFAATGDLAILTEGMIDEPLTVEEMEQAATDLSGIIDTGPIDDPSVDTDDDLLELDIPDDGEDEFSGLFDDIDEEEADDGPSDAPAAF